MTSTTTTPIRGGIGTSVRRPDGEPKVRGNFAYASDLTAPDMVWGATRRSPHAHARLVSMDLGPAEAMDGVLAVLTQDDVPGKPTFGQEEQDQRDEYRDKVDQHRLVDAGEDRRPFQQMTDGREFETCSEEHR